MITDDLIVEARARIIWGDEPASVRCFLTSNGMATAEADAKIKELTLERNAEIRKLGIRDVLIGVVVMAAAIIFFYMLFARSNIPSQTVRSGKGYGVLALAALYGLWRLVNGVIRLVRPKSEHGSIPDISE
jgi:hypothetical protein